MASPEMFLSSPSRPRRRIATSPLVISSSPDLPSLQNLGSQPPRPPIFRSPTPTTTTHHRPRTRFTSAPDAQHEAVNLSPTAVTVVDESHYRFPSKENPHRSPAHNEMSKRLGNPDTARRPLLLSSSPVPSSEVAVTESKYFKKPDNGAAESKDAAAVTVSLKQDAPLNIERAATRRLDWTPPKCQPPVEPGNANLIPTQSGDEEADRSVTISRVLEPFKCDVGSTSTTASRSDEDGGIFRKRKLVDAVSTGAGQSPSIPVQPAKSTKKTATKKKPRTITGLATAAYKLASQPETGAGESYETGTSKADDQSATLSLEQKDKPARKRTARAPSKRKKKAPPPPKPVLLSPSAALRQVANQDFLFGTSSQLAQENSPKFLRDLAIAMKNSNAIDYGSLSTPINSDAIEPPQTKRSLWDAAARDRDGELFDLGVQELAEKSQDLPILEAQADPFGYVKEASPTGDDSFLDLSDALLPQKPPTEQHPSADQPSSVSCSQDTGFAPPVAGVEQRAPRPDFELYTDAQLASAVSSYGFKNVRQRGARIALLERCWQGKNQVATLPGERSASTLAASKLHSPVKLGRAKSPVKTPIRPESSLASASQPQEPPPSAQPMSPPKRPRGRPRKTPEPSLSLSESASLCAAAMLHPASGTLAPVTPKRSKAQSSKFVVEIPDSDSDANGLNSLSASPSSVLEETFSPSQQVDLSLSMEEDELSMVISTCDKPASFEYISKAITSAPRSKDVNNPSWHEKILIYDPIVLEDLTAWLNCGPLTQAGYDDEVSSGEVKKWYFMRSHLFIVGRRIKSIHLHRVAPCRTLTTTTLTSNLSISATSVHRAPNPNRPRPFSSATAPPENATTTSTSAKPHKMPKDGPPPAPRPSSSVVLLSPTNEILLLHRVKTSTSFASAHVFPGGNVDPFHDGDVPAEDSPDRHRDGPAYRMCAIRETFEESGILLAKKDGKLVQISEQEREEARKQIHARKIKFGDWLSSIGATADTDSLLPYTRWLTPLSVPKRFTTQMYLYLLPLSRKVPSKMLLATPDGGIEHTAASFASPQAWMKQANEGKVILFPPQFFILHTVGRYVGGGKPGSLEEESKRFMLERRKLLKFVRQVPTATTALGREHPTSQVAWADKVISPLPMYARDRDGDRRVVLSLNYPGPELEGSDRVGDFEHVVLTKFGKGGPTGVEVRLREEILDEGKQPKEGRLEKL
ncbi:hypothetical protein PWT90_09014 [Aphanocladium album]|nr:hypothetical protein PWT90_09014 [Aphanocladium album]